MKGAKAPRCPTQEEREEHERCHIPFRSWCRHCKRGKTRASPHFSKEPEPPDKPIVSMDYAFLGAHRSGTKAERLAEEEAASSKGHTPVMVVHNSEQGGIYMRTQCPARAPMMLCARVWYRTWTTWATRTSS